MVSAEGFTSSRERRQTRPRGRGRGGGRGRGRRPQPARTPCSFLPNTPADGSKPSSRRLRSGCFAFQSHGPAPSRPEETRRASRSPKERGRFPASTRAGPGPGGPPVREVYERFTARGHGHAATQPSAFCKAARGAPRACQPRAYPQETDADHSFPAEKPMTTRPRYPCQTAAPPRARKQPDPGPGPLPAQQGRPAASLRAHSPPGRAGEGRGGAVTWAARTRV